MLLDSLARIATFYLQRSYIKGKNIRLDSDSSDGMGFYASQAEAIEQTRSQAPNNLIFRVSYRDPLTLEVSPYTLKDILEVGACYQEFIKIDHVPEAKRNAPAAPSSATAPRA